MLDIKEIIPIGHAISINAVATASLIILWRFCLFIVNQTPNPLKDRRFCKICGLLLF